MNKEHLLITGTPGWLGNRFLENLSKKAYAGKIDLLVLPESDTLFLKNLSLNSSFHFGDITKKETLLPFFKQAEGAVLVHLAGIIHPRLSVRSFYQVNVEGTKNLLECAKEYGVKKVIILSSNSPLGCNPNNTHLFVEDSPYNPYMGYGCSKMEMEHLALRFESEHDLDVTLLRACWFYGPHQPKRQTQFFSMIKEGKFPIVGSGENVRSMSHVDNLCLGIELAINSPLSRGKIYWIADARPYSMNEIIKTVRELMKDMGFQVKAKQPHLPNFVGHIATGVDAALQRLLLYNKQIHVFSELNKNIACSIAKAQEELGYVPPVALREGMQQSLEWCLAHGYAL